MDNAAALHIKRNTIRFGRDSFFFFCFFAFFSLTRASIEMKQV